MAITFIDLVFCSVALFGSFNWFYVSDLKRCLYATALYFVFFPAVFIILVIKMATTAQSVEKV
jgi:hypothetical protein